MDWTFKLYLHILCHLPVSTSDWSSRYMNFTLHLGLVWTLTWKRKRKRKKIPVVTWLDHQWLDYQRLCPVPLPLIMDNNIMGDPEAELEPDAFKQLIIDFHVCCQHLVMLLSIVLAQILSCSAALFSKLPHIPHHTSILTGKAWVLELTSANPQKCARVWQISTEFVMFPQ